MWWRENNMEYSVLIVAAGNGTRMKLGYNKVYAKMKDGRSVIETTISVFQKDPDCHQIIVVTDPEEFRKRMSGKYIENTDLCAGGSTRQESVSRGLALVKYPYVMIHDGARPFVTVDLLDRLKDAMKKDRAALLMVPVKDTVKKVENGYVTGTFIRSELMAAQTPQMFETSLIRSCMEKAQEEGYTGTDDASLVERFSDVRVRAVDGAYYNYKITTPEDLR